MCENALPIHSCHFSSFSILHTLALIHDISLNPIKIEHDCFLYCGVTLKSLLFHNDCLANGVHIKGTCMERKVDDVTRWIWVWTKLKALIVTKVSRSGRCPPWVSCNNQISWFSTERRCWSWFHAYAGLDWRLFERSPSSLKRRIVKYAPTVLKMLVRWTKRTAWKPITLFIVWEICIINRAFCMKYSNSIIRVTKSENFPVSKIFVAKTFRIKRVNLVNFQIRDKCA